MTHFKKIKNLIVKPFKTLFSKENLELIFVFLWWCSLAYVINSFMNFK